MKKLTISVKEITYNRLKNICMFAKNTTMKEQDKPLIVSDKDIAKLVSFCVNDKTFNEVLKRMEEITK